MISSNVKLKQQIQSLLAQSDVLRNEIENQKTLKIESDSLMRAARDRIHGLLAEIAALKNEAENLRNLISESDNLAKEAGD